jgi:hypothetical protein
VFDRENWIGLLLLGLCGAVGGVLLWTIATRATLTYDGPGWIPVVVTVLYVAGLLYSLFRMPKTWL